MLFRKDSHFVPSAIALILLVAAPLFTTKIAAAQASSSSSSSSSSSPTFAEEKAPSLVDPAGPAIELIPSEQLFFMAAALNQCGYDEGLAESDPMRQAVRDQIHKALAGSEDARKKRDAVCLYIAQHRMTGTVKDISQYVSLALYLTPPPALETSVELPEMPPDSTQVVEVLPLLRDFAAAVDLHGIWLSLHHSYDDYVNQLHDSLTKMILATNYYLKMPVSTYDGRRFVVVVEPQLNPRTVNARIYGTDYVVVVSPVHNQIRMLDVRHTYLHYLIEPLLYRRADAMERYLPILKEVREAPLDYRYRSDIVDLTIECLIKAIEARTMDTGIKPYETPTDERRQDFARIETERNAVAARMEAVRVTQVRHDMNQGWVLTAYFYEQLLHFERDPASIDDSIGEIVYSMDIDHEVHRARDITFDQQADDDVLRRTAPRKLTGLDLAEAKLSTGDPATAASMARLALTAAASDPAVDTGRANFILARTAIMGGDPDSAIADFEKAAETAKETRIRAWSHIYLGRMMDLACKRNDAVTQYNQALAVRDGQQDTRLAAERGLKTAYAAKQSHTCQADDSDDDSGPAAKDTSANDGSKPEAGNAQAPAPGSPAAASSGSETPK